jgi:hypothetical protein
VKDIDRCPRGDAQNSSKIFFLQNWVVKGADLYDMVELVAERQIVENVEYEFVPREKIILEPEINCWMV